MIPPPLYLDRCLKYGKYSISTIVITSCSNCQINRLEYTPSNDMLPLYNIQELQTLTFVEKSLCSPVTAAMKISLGSFNNFSSGNMILLEQNTFNF